MCTPTEEVPGIKTRFLVLSDTHGIPLATPLQTKADVVLHCGDLTEHSTLAEMRVTLQLLKDLTAPLKLVIAGNHDFTLDDGAYESKLQEGDRVEVLDRNLVRRDFGDFGQARNLLLKARDDGIVFLDEGTHTFSLVNGAQLRVYASPYTPSSGGNWGFQYSGEHLFDIEPNTSVVMTHGPPQGILDRTRDKKRIGCSQLFSAVAQQQPLMHCFGHVHDGWGARMVTWREGLTVSGSNPSHFTHIDNEKSVIIDSLPRSKLGESGGSGGSGDKEHGIAQYRSTSHCEQGEDILGNGRTLFVNASIKADGDDGQLPWVVDVLLPKTTG